MAIHVWRHRFAGRTLRLRAATDMTTTAVKQRAVSPDDFPSDIHLKKILVTTDFTAGSRQALPYAVNMARKFGASITLLYVVPSARSAEVMRIGILLEKKRLE